MNIFFILVNKNEKMSWGSRKSRKTKPRRDKNGVPKKTKKQLRRLNKTIAKNPEFTKTYRNRKVESFYRSQNEIQDIKNKRWNKNIKPYYHHPSWTLPSYRNNISLEIKKEKSVYDYKYSLFALHQIFHSNDLIRQIMAYHPLIYWETKTFQSSF